uniref:Uncharacterized protein n=1 Tax=Picea sitchensis TaxID=3332 RepID=A9NUM9_PICSI|nr:unknown [Picea sitchensis]
MASVSVLLSLTVPYRPMPTWVTHGGGSSWRWRNETLKTQDGATLRQGSGLRCRRVVGSGKPCRCAGRQPEFAEKQVEDDVWQWSKTPGQLVAYGLLLAGMPLGSLLPDSSWSPACYFLCLGVWTVYVGSHRSLGTKPPKKLSFQEGILVPLFLSLSLFGFYCLLHFFPNIDLQAFLSAYFALAGVFAVTGNMVDVVGTLFPTTNMQLFQTEVPKWILQDNESPVKLTSTYADLLAFSIGIAIVIANKQAGASFTFNNIIATCIATELLRLFSLGSFVTAASLLSGLLLYDVFWVFGSSHVFGDNVMLTVATSSAFDGPIKLIFPHLEGNSTFPYSLLGLGDVAVPGLLTALMLRFDRSRDSTRIDGAIECSSTGPLTKPDKTYFSTCIASYIFGLALTVVANGVSKAAQPALLYLVPSQLISIFLVSLKRSEIDLLFDYKEEIAGVEPEN